MTLQRIDFEDMTKPCLSYEEAASQATSTTIQYLDEAIEMIDNQFGNGYAKKNPGLIAPLVNSQVQDFNNCTLVRALWEISESLDRPVT
tara:strand:- start:764 stop:1030 length:267 start_codon:yes stop_codon:yes gene_type:complete